MRFKIKSQKKFLAVMFSIFLLAFFVLGLEIKADSYGLDETRSVVGKDNKPLSETLKEADIATQIGTIVGAVLAFVGVIFLILMIYGGFLWMTAGGNEEAVKKAQGLIIAAVVGIIIISSAYLITKFIGETLLPSNTPPSPVP